MKTNRLPFKTPLGLAAVALAALGLFSAQAAESSARPASLQLRPLSPSDIKDYSLPANTQVASGMDTVGIGQPVHLEALMDIGTADSSILDVAWTLSARPVGSAAALEDSPLGASVPTYEMSDRATAKLVGRTFLRPDVAGQYTITGVITTTSGTKTLTKKVTAANYLGINGCILCHSGSQVTEDKVTPWSHTKHATFLTRAIDGQASDHYAGYCISCHTVGYDVNTNAVNRGFDDIAKELNYKFPTNFVAGNWAAMPAALKNLSNIQCENCHGPGSEHALDAVANIGSLIKPGKISVTYASGSCGQCHDAKTHHKNNAEWNNSRHAVATTSPTGPGRAGCVQCHTAIGFAEWATKGSTTNVAYAPISCAGCHDPHSDGNPHQLRKAGPVTLQDGTLVASAGAGAICMNCHMARRNVATYVETTAPSAHFGPHYGTQADMLAGANGYTYGKTIPSSGHRAIVEDSCVTCHMQAVAANQPGFTHAGGHTFNLSSDNGTPDDHSDDVHLTQACADCHGPTSNFNLVRSDYDGNGVAQGVQDEVKGLLKQLAMLLPPYGTDKDHLAINNSWTRQQLRAAWNFSFVHDDGSYGVHNTAYAVGLLKASIADLKDDADNDGVSDKWEIARFGSIVSYDGNADPDGDGVSNMLELAAGTNPMLADSDNDGISDLAELRAGSDPMSAQDKPGFIVKMYNAAEIEFVAEAGKTYQIQKVSEISGTWENWGEPVTGNGGLVSRLTSLRADEKAYFRVKAQ